MRGSIAVVLVGCVSRGPDPGDEHPQTGVAVTVDQAGVLACADPGPRSAGVPFTRMWDKTVPDPTIAWIWAGGATVLDLNEDGRLDVLSALEQGLRLNEGSEDPTNPMPEVRNAAFASSDLSFASGISAADYDGDGDLDLYVTRIAGDPAPAWSAENRYGENRLLRNDGNGVFVDVTDQAGVGGCGIDPRSGEQGCWKSMTASWGDIDGDGDLDLYVGDYGYVDQTNGSSQDQFEPAEPDFLYLNNGDGTFADASATLPDEVSLGYTYSGGLFDLDDDGDLDLFTVNDFGNVVPNRVMWNDGAGAFTVALDGDPSGLDQGMTGMGLGVGDLNGDGLPELVIPNWNYMALFQSLWAGDHPVWVESADAHGLVLDPDRADKYVGWGTELGDMDNDGDLDVVSQFGHLDSDNPSKWGNAMLQPDALYLNEPDPNVGYRFVDQAAAWHVDDPGMSRGVVLADVNRDGWLDLVKRSLDDGNVLYLSNCGSEGWLEVSLRQPGTMNVFGVGAKITVEGGGLVQTRTITAGGTGYASEGPLEAHFGLGNADTVDRITVRWPDGQESSVTAIDARQRITLTR